MKLPFYKWYPKDFHSDPHVKRLSPLARGCYRDILDLMWMGQYGYKLVLNDKTITQQLGLRPKQWEKVKSELLDPSGPVFDQVDGFLVNNRMKAEYIEACETVAQKSEAGKQSGRARRRKAEEELSKVQMDFLSSEKNEAFEEAEEKKAKTGKNKNASYLDEDEREFGAYCGWLPTNRFNTMGEVFNVPESFVEMLQATYPAVDIQYQLSRAYSWLVTNPAKRKTLTGMNRFLDKWMEREQNKAGGGHSPFQPPSAPGSQRKPSLRRALGMSEDTVSQGGHGNHGMEGVYEGAFRRERGG